MSFESWDLTPMSTITSKPGRAAVSRPPIIASWVLMDMWHHLDTPDQDHQIGALQHKIYPSHSYHSMSLELYHTTHNAGQTTVVLIHGALVSGLYWDLVIPHLPKSYHLLVPDLPGHGKSQSTPFSIDLASHMIAQLIRAHAITGSAHIIGHSLGAQVAIRLASTDPDVVNSIFISGFGMFPRTSITPYIPYAAWAMSRVENCLARPLISWAMDGADIPHIDTDLCTLDLCRQIVAPEEPTEWPVPWPARTLIVAAGKGGLIPTKDSSRDAVKLVEIGRELNDETVAYTHLGMRHPWNRQAPRLFAETAEAWFERMELPGGFVKL